MQYFKNFPRVPYIFGNLKEVGDARVTTEIYQNISTTADIF